MSLITGSKLLNEAFQGLVNFLRSNWRNVGLGSAFLSQSHKSVSIHVPIKIVSCEWRHSLEEVRLHRFYSSFRANEWTDAPKRSSLCLYFEFCQPRRQQNNVLLHIHKTSRFYATCFINILDFLWVISVWACVYLLFINLSIFLKIYFNITLYLPQKN